MTITEFLEGRISEDADTITALTTVESRDWMSQYERTILSAYRDRIRMEGRAKRAIVEAWQRADGDAEIEQGLCVAVLHLAAVYADHPDYDDTWRP